GFRVAQLRVEFVLELVARSSRALSERVATLNHEAVDDSVEDRAVVERRLHFLTAARIGPLLGAVRQAGEVGDGFRSLLFEQLNVDVALGRVKMRVQHWYALPGGQHAPSRGPE